MEFASVTWRPEFLQLPLGAKSLKCFQADPLEECSMTGCNRKPDRQYRLVGAKTEIIGLCDDCAITVRKRLSVAVLLEEINSTDAIVYRIMST